MCSLFTQLRIPFLLAVPFLAACPGGGQRTSSGSSMSTAGGGTSGGSSGTPFTGDVTGAWQGTMSYGSASRPIGFTLVDDGGAISGNEIL